MKRVKAHSVTALGVEFQSYTVFYFSSRDVPMWSCNTMNLFHHLKQKHLAKYDDCNKLLLPCRRNTCSAALNGSYSPFTECHMKIKSVCVLY